MKSAPSPLRRAVVFIAPPARELFVEPEGEPARNGFFVAGFFVVAVPDVEGDGDGSAGLELDIDLLVDDFQFTLYY